MDLFSATQRPDSALFYQRNDVNDPRLGETVRSDPRDYDAAQVVLLGCPQDEGVRRNGGRLGASQAPDEIRRYFYRLTPTGIEAVRVFDLGNTRLQAMLEDTHALHSEVVAQVLGDGKRLMVLGGGNDTSYADCAGLARVESDILAFNVDTHYDVRADQPRNSGTPYRQLLEEGILKPHQFYEMGNHDFANSAFYSAYLKQQGVTVQTLTHLRLNGVGKTFQEIVRTSSAQAIFWGLDMDVVRQSDAPGVSAPNPLGITGDEFCEVARVAGADPRTRLFEITEVNPVYDIDGRTCRLAALALWSFLSAGAVTER